MQTSNSSQNKRHKQEFYGSKLSQCLCDDFAKGKCLRLMKLSIRQQQFSVSWPM